jgi:hypothetical protein
MTTRIGLFTPRKRRKKGQTSTTTTYVEVATPAELTAKMIALGAKRTGLLSRDRDGNTEVQGEMFAPTALSDKHLAWLTAKPAEFETRGLFYD